MNPVTKPGALPKAPSLPPLVPPSGAWSFPVRESFTASLSLRVLAGVAVLFALYFGKSLLVPLVLSLFFWMLLRPIVRWLDETLCLPTSLAAALTMGCLIGALSAGVVPLIDPAMAWLDKAPTTFQELDTRLSRLKKKLGTMRKASARLDDIAQMGAEKPRQMQVAVRPESIVAKAFAGAQSFLVDAFSVLILVFFLLSSGDLFLRKAIRVSSSLRAKIRAVKVVRRVEREVGRYLLLVAAINLGLGIVTTAALAALGMPNPWLWGAMVALFNFVPYVGATASTLVLAVVALTSYDNLGDAFMVPAVFVGLAALEGQLIQPSLVGRHCSISPVVVFCSLLFWGWMWGVPGMLVAVPILVACKVLCAHVDGLAKLGEFLERE